MEGLACRWNLPSLDVQSSQIAASFVIARRGMHFQRNEKVPKQYKDMIKDIKTKHYWSKFNKIEKELKKTKRTQK